jgi:glycosyltransferase involved in cell wall biosynthesis
VCFVEHTSSLIGGGQISVFQLAEDLTRLGVRVHFVCPGQGPFCSRLVDAGFKVSLVDTESFRGGRAIKLAPAVVGMRRVLRATRTDLVHANSARAALIGGIAGRLSGVPMLWHLRVPGSEPLYDHLLSILSKNIIAISSHVAQRVCFAEEKTLVIYNGVSTMPQIEEHRKEKLKTDLGLAGCPVVGIVSQIIGSKRIDLFLKAARLVLQQLPETRFLIVGGEVPAEKGLLNRLRAMARELKIEKNILFTGFQEDVYAYLSLMDVFSFFSEREAFGRVVAEAMMARLPVVSAATGGIPEIVDDGISGFLFQNGDYYAASERIVFLLRSHEARVRMGDAGLAKAAQSFERRKTAQRIHRLYREVLGLPGPGETAK